mmetsp:Transcript_45319/g.140748  ORF Transcript_45319/g.140748 Transcript_45319/m.140748 type:complete len:202 (+) Transcript_45319:734-1339(+)
MRPLASVILPSTVLYKLFLTVATSPIAQSGLTSRSFTALKAGSASTLQKLSNVSTASFSWPAARSCVMSPAKYELSLVSMLSPFDCTGSKAASWKKSHILSVVADTASLSFSITSSAVRVADTFCSRSATAPMVDVTLPFRSASPSCIVCKLVFAAATSALVASSSFKASSSPACFSVVMSSRSSRSSWASPRASSAAWYS